LGLLGFEYEDLHEGGAKYEIMKLQDGDITQLALLQDVGQA
jgi:hypothetical protein